MKVCAIQCLFAVILFLALQGSSSASQNNQTGATSGSLRSLVPADLQERARQFITRLGNNTLLRRFEDALQGLGNASSLLGIFSRVANGSGLQSGRLTSSNSGTSDVETVAQAKQILEALQKCVNQGGGGTGTTGTGGTGTGNNPDATGGLQTGGRQTQGGSNTNTQTGTNTGGRTRTGRRGRNNGR